MRLVSPLTGEQQQRLRAELKRANKARSAQLLAAYQATLMPDLMEWATHFFPHYCKLNPSLMHRQIVRDLQWQHLDRGVKRSYVAPRGGAKTAWVSKMYPLYCVCHGLEEYILITADSTDQAVENLEAIRFELEGNELLEDAYPAIVGQGSQWNQNQIVTRNGIKIQAAGKGKKVRGRGHRAVRPSLIIGDDLENDESVMSDEQRTKTWNWITRALLPAGQPDTNVLMVGTALHPDDAMQRLKVQPGWRSKSFAALIQEPTNQKLWETWRERYRDISVDPMQRETDCREFYETRRDEMDVGAELLWPEREPLYDLMRWRESNGEQSFQSEKQGNAAATGATEWPLEYFGASCRFDVWPNLGLKAMALDPSKSKEGSRKKNDPSAFVWGGIGEDGNIYVDADVDWRDASKVVEDGIRIYRQFLPHSFGLETVMFQQLFEVIFTLEARRLGILLPITQINPHEQKEVRLRQLTPYLRSGRIKFKAGSRGADILIDQLKWFPTAKHDDAPDALHMMLLLLLALSGQNVSQSDGLNVAVT